MIGSTTTSRTTKLVSYSGMATAFLTLTSEADAQVVYTNVDPDDVLVTADHEVDFDGDGVVDITIRHYSSSQYQSARAIEGSGNYMVQTAASSTYPAVLNLNDPIAPTNPYWDAWGTLAFVYSGAVYGVWSGQAGFLGVKFQIGANTHYGWVELAVANGATSVTVLGYAYESTPNTAINAGDQGVSTGIETLAPLTALGVAPNPAHDRSIVTFRARKAGTMQLSLLNSLGQVVQDRSVNIAEGANTVDLSLEALPPGTYSLRFQSEGVVRVRKVVKH